MTSFHTIICLFLLTVGSALCSSDLKVCVNSGCVLGKREPGLLHSYNAWYGIPFAEPPVGKLRFRSPKPPMPWRDTYNATFPRSQCAQLDVTTKRFSGSEDCLYLNVYRPVLANVRARKPEPLFPVIVFIHGGSFKGGSSSPNLYGPEFLMDNQQVIIVTLQYRLGVFGFLAANDVSVKGNYGLKDQNMALQWVHRNIRQFRGDPGSVTLIGQSAGAASAQHQMMTKRSNGLFHRAVLMSGSALAFWAIDKRPEILFRQYANLAGIPNSARASPRDIVTELRKKSAKDLVNAEVRIPILHPVLFVFRPVIERSWRNAIIEEDPECLWKSGKYEHRPFLTGVTGYEQGTFGDLYYNETVRGFIKENWEESMASALDYPISVLKPIKDFYHDGFVTDENMINILQARDRLLDYPLYETVDYYTRYANLKENPVNVYHFNFTSQISNSIFTNPFPIKGRGASHSDDLLYLFRTKHFAAAFQGQTPESEMKDFFVRFIVDYAKYGRSQWNQAMSCRKQDLATGFCEFLDIQRDFSTNPNRVKLSVKKEFDGEMVHVHKFVDKLISRVYQDFCPSNVPYL